jgi:hypothetical protein
MPVHHHRATRRRWLWQVPLAVVMLYALLLIPEREPAVPESASNAAFRWDRDGCWRDLEFQFQQQRGAGQRDLDAAAQRALADLGSHLKAFAHTNLPPDAPAFDVLETNFFQLAPMIGACPERLPDYVELFARLRSAVKLQSTHWSMDSRAARERLYRSLYGGRAALEEVMLQVPGSQLQPLLLGENEPFATPAAKVAGVELHSGDILISRGGAATSALIARGNDFTGNFSHVALVHVEERTHAVSVIESHIESGVGVFPIERYLTDTKLRIMVLRLRADLPALMADPQLPHKAATKAMNDASRQHIPYDFAMDFNDPAKQFCSEVASSAYGEFGVRLWMGMSHLSTTGVIEWLSSLGVRHFETQEPSDLEYDPQLCVVAEWRDAETLFKDHVDNAVIDAMLERAEVGQRLRYNRWMLPFVRGLKAWSVVKNWFGGVGPIPEGMSASTALRVDRLTTQHDRMAARVRRWQKRNAEVSPPGESLLLGARPEPADAVSPRSWRRCPAPDSSRPPTRRGDDL